MKVLLVDAKDSFVHIIDQYLRSLGCDTVVARSRSFTTDDVRAFDPGLLVLGPGPGHPRDSGHVELVRRYGGAIPLFGICLGHQAIGLAYGGSVARAAHLVHGRTSDVVHDGRGAFRAVPQSFPATRYHSLVVDADTVPDGLEVTATSATDGYVMGLRHRQLPVESVQFHPESVCTGNGHRLLDNVITTAAAGRPT